MLVSDVCNPSSYSLPRPLRTRHNACPACSQYTASCLSRALRTLYQCFFTLPSVRVGKDCTTSGNHQIHMRRTAMPWRSLPSSCQHLSSPAAAAPQRGSKVCLSDSFWVRVRLQVPLYPLPLVPDRLCCLQLRGWAALRTCQCSVLPPELSSFSMVVTSSVPVTVTEG